MPSALAVWIATLKTDRRLRRILALVAVAAAGILELQLDQAALDWLLSIGNAMTKHLFISLVLFVLSMASAFADITPLVGVSQFTWQPDGVWYQKAFPYTLRTRDMSWGVRYDSDRHGDWGWSAGYMNLGHVSSDSYAVALDANYNEHAKTCNGPCWPTSSWIGYGGVQGVYGSGTYRIGNIDLEAGAYFYVPTWTMHIPNWIECPTCTPRDVQVAHDSHIQVGPMLGLRYNIQPWSINMSFWHTATQGDEWTALFHNTTYNLSVGYSFK